MTTGLQGDDDKFSCAVITWNMVEHTLFDDELWDAASRDLIRIKYAIRLVDAMTSLVRGTCFNL